MATIIYGFSVRSSGALQAGLTPTWSALYKLSDGSSVASPNSVAPITALGGGLYRIAYDPESANGEIYGVIDAGASISSPADRYIDVLLAADSSRATRLDATVSSRAIPGSAMTLADGAITAAKIADGAITAAKIATNAIDADALAADAVAEIAAAASATLLRGPYELFLDGPEGLYPAGDVLYVGERPTLLVRVLDKDKSPVVLASDVTAKLSRLDTGAAVGDPIVCTIRDDALGLAAVDIPTAATDATLAGKRLQLTVSWTVSGRLSVAGALILEIRAR